MSTISIEVDKEAARSFFQASVDEKRHLNFLLNLRLKELMLNYQEDSLESALLSHNRKFH